MTPNLWLQLGHYRKEELSVSLIVPLVENSTFSFCINDTRNCMIVQS